MILSFLRILKFSLQDITRNVWLSVITITIITLAFFSINTLLVLRLVSDNAVIAIKEKVDISLYIRPDISESEIFELRNQITAMEGVSFVKYISKQDALNFFRERNSDNEEVLQAVLELGENPLSASLVVVPEDVNQSTDLIEKLKAIDTNIIESRDFSDNSLLLEKIDNITKSINDIGLVVIIIFIITNLLVVYNSIKVAVYTQKREIEVMRLVGASNAFIYLPFLLSAIIYTLVAIAIIIAVFFPLLGVIQPYLEVFFVDYNINIVSYFLENLVTVFGIQFAAMALINVLASYLAVKKYANV